MMLTVAAGEDEIGSGAVELRGEQQFGVGHEHRMMLKTHDGLRTHRPHNPPATVDAYAIHASQSSEKSKTSPEPACRQSLPRNCP